MYFINNVLLKKQCFFWLHVVFTLYFCGVKQTKKNKIMKKVEKLEKINEVDKQRLQTYNFTILQGKLKTLAKKMIFADLKPDTGFYKVTDLDIEQVIIFRFSKPDNILYMFSY